MMIWIVREMIWQKTIELCVALLDTEIELTHHNGTVRDLIFMHDNLTDDSILLSGGAGDCKIYVTDVKKQTPIKSFNGHQGKSQ